MRYGIFSDIHGNLEAFEAVIAALEKESVDVYLCAGDTIGYGADPDVCLERLRCLKAKSVAGNHEWAVLGNMTLMHFNPVAREAILWTENQLGPDEKDFLKTFPLKFKNDDLMMVHGTWQHESMFEYLTSLRKAQEMFALMDRDIGFVGHTHVPMILEQNDEEISFVSSFVIKPNPDRKYIVNVGSVGQPRDGDPRAAYAVYDTKAKEVAVRRVSYPVVKAQEKIRQAGLPGMLADRLEIGF
ncbi:MAG: metallophosphoesterase family protein [Candidatus Omnitrophica bacterium]|nr:metallophosphoesterase family protein [Candidatus Omnitrophota bacterium]